VIFISGHTEDDVVRRLADKRRVGMVPKPFKASNLNRAIAALLNQSSGS